MIPNKPRYATRLNAFKQKGDTVAQMIAAAARVGGLDAADLNFPDHFDHHSPAELSRLLADNGMALNGLAMRYYTDPGFRLGAFSHPEPATRRIVHRRGQAGPRYSPAKSSPSNSPRKVLAPDRMARVARFGASAPGPRARSAWPKTIEAAKRMPASAS